MSNRVKIDEKGRLKIPAALLAELNGVGSDLYVTSEDGENARIYPMHVWNQVEEQLARLSAQHSKSSQKLLTRAKYFGQSVRMDEQGRVLIPPSLRRAAQIKGEVDLLAYPNYLEVWNHTRFLDNLKRDPITTEDEKTLREIERRARAIGSPQGEGSRPSRARRSLERGRKAKG